MAARGSWAPSKSNFNILRIFNILREGGGGGVQHWRQVWASSECYAVKWEDYQLKNWRFVSKQALNKNLNLSN